MFAANSRRGNSQKFLEYSPLKRKIQLTKVKRMSVFLAPIDVFDQMPSRQAGASEIGMIDHALYVIVGGYLVAVCRPV